MTARPGRIIEIIDVPLVRPRSYEQESLQEFQDCAKRIRQHIFGGRLRLRPNRRSVGSSACGTTAAASCCRCSRSSSSARPWEGAVRLFEIPVYMLPALSVIASEYLTNFGLVASHTLATLGTV